MVLEILLCAIIVVQSIIHFIERDKLQDRIMSRNLAEYKSKEPPHHPISAHERTLRKWRGSDNE